MVIRHESSCQTEKDAKQMTGAQVSGAASGIRERWESIEWKTMEAHVHRLQVRIVKAVQQGKWGRVQALQRILTHSYSAKTLAVKRVTENRGKRTAGVDRVLWSTARVKGKAICALRERGYTPLPLRRVYIPKSNGKMRPLSIPAMRDRAMQALYLLALEPIVETTGDANSYGFRKHRSTADAIQQCFTILSGRRSAQWILEGDITACFDRIRHDWLIANIPMNRTILRKWLEAGYMEKGVFNFTQEGAPQGASISPAIATMALDGLEPLLHRAFPVWKRQKVHFVRYADDFVITASSKELLEREVRPTVEAFLAERGLELSQEKTRITHIDDGFDFLGQNVRKYKGKLLIKPSKKSIKALLDTVRKTVKGSRALSPGMLIRRLNPRIRGWANYHRHVVSKRTFSAIDYTLVRVLWKWARRRHPSKSSQWIWNKYFWSTETCGGIFVGELTKRGGSAELVHLWKIAYMPIVRHRKIIGTANPYDSTWTEYFQTRRRQRQKTPQRYRRFEQLTKNSV